jgi:signal transduction histidine kinase
MRLSATLLAAGGASASQLSLMNAAGVSTGPMVAAVAALFLVAWASHVGADRVWRLAGRIARSEAERLLQVRRNEELAAAEQRILVMLEEADARNQQLEHLHQDREDLVQVLVHDLRNPLTALTTTLEMMERRLKRTGGAENLKDPVERSLQSTRRLSRMIAELLDVSKLEEGHLHPSRSLVALSELVPPLADRDDRVEVESSPDLLLPIDRDLFMRVIENLVSNALRYTPAGGRILIRAGRDGAGYVLSVHNTGNAVPRLYERRIFEKFQRGTNDKQRGWGLGLYFCRLAVEAHGGRIALEDVPDWPVSFVIRIPEPAAPSAAKTAADTSPRTAAQAS